MIKAFECKNCRERHDVWRQYSANMPDSDQCPLCGGIAFPVDAYATIIHFKGVGWTPKAGVCKDLRDVKGVPDHIGEMLD